MYCSVYLQLRVSLHVALRQLVRGLDHSKPVWQAAGDCAVTQVPWHDLAWRRGGGSGQAVIAPVV